MQTVSTSPDETKALGRTLAASLKPGDVVALSGTLGTGKTCFVQGVCEALGVHAHVSSPTFTLINEYPVSFGKIVHIDLYRIAARAELAQLGIEEYFTDCCLCLVEWPELLADILPPQTWHVTIRHGSGENERMITIDGGTLSEADRNPEGAREGDSKHGPETTPRGAEGRAWKGGSKGGERDPHDRPRH